MLNNLLIKNYALIKELELQPCKGLNIITGETGAGKSIMLGALGLLLGNRADSKVLFDPDQKCIIEGTFDVSKYDLEEYFSEDDIDKDTICLIRREVASNGKSRAFINDTPVTLDVLKKWGLRLMDIHSQHETLMLGSQKFQIAILDSYSGNHVTLSEYQKKYREYLSLKDKLDKLKETAADLSKEKDFNNYLFAELDEAQLQINEQERLEEELKMLENAEEIKAKLSHVSHIFSEDDQSVTANISVCLKAIDAISKFSEEYERLRGRIRSVMEEIKDISFEISAKEGSIEFNPARVEEINDRLSVIYKLQKKHNADNVAILLEIRQALEEKLKSNISLEEEINSTEKELNLRIKELKTVAVKLRETRKAGTGGLKKQLEMLMKEVGMPNATVEITMEDADLGLFGMDKICLLFSANKGIAPVELKNAASGGEFSRLMLCVKYVLAEKTSLPTIVFDEIDTGISGEVAIKVGKMLAYMAKKHQIVSISHLPQIAARGEAHFFVYKDHSSDRSVSKIRKLNAEERIKEIATMIGGEKPSDTALKNAKELLSVKD
ncbi:MAG: DNA repair protein RecN [Cytophagaceae bacterium]